MFFTIICIRNPNVISKISRLCQKVSHFTSYDCSYRKVTLFYIVDNRYLRHRISGIYSRFSVSAATLWGGPDICILNTILNLDRIYWTSNVFNLYFSDDINIYSSIHLILCTYLSKLFLFVIARVYMFFPFIS